MQITGGVWGVLTQHTIGVPSFFGSKWLDSQQHSLADSNPLSLLEKCQVGSDRGPRASSLDPIKQE